ncbi:penicillin-binding protein, partial [Aquimarina celericrescens]|nr:penicillin-binding protein [Aquimarina celericrescens]
VQSLPLTTFFSPEEHDDGIATYFRAYVQEFMKDWIEDNPKPDGSSYSMYRDGLKIYTSVDYKMQTYAETAVEKHLKNLQKEFDRQNQNNKTAPFRSIDASEIESILK